MKHVREVVRIFLDVALPFFRSEERWAARALLAGVVLAELGIVYVAVSVIHWNARFFNALEARDWTAFATELKIFALITCGAIVAGMMQYYFGQTLLIRWRRWMTERYAAVWMADGRHYLVRFVDNSVDNIHLRIGNDVLLFVQRTLELGTGLLNSIVALASFAYILWGLSAGTPLLLFGSDFSFPGYLICAALAYATIGTLVAHWIGQPLIQLNFNQQRFESDFRFALARVTDHAEPVALMRGEAVERAELDTRFSALVRNWTALVRRHTRLTGFVAGYGHVSTVFPILILSPAFLTGAIQLGTLIQAHLAFQRVEGAFAFCISAYSKLAEWKAITDRLSQFEAAMAGVDTHRRQADGTISIAAGAGDSLDVSGLVMRLPSGAAIAELPALSVAPGDRVAIAGPSGSGKSSLLRALTGLWPYGEGHIALPPDREVLVMPQRPYFPLGSLRQALTYPMPAETVNDEDLRRAMAVFGLSHLADRLHETAEWNVVLSGGEQQRIAFVRALLRRPAVLMLDEPVAALADVTGCELYRTLTEHLRDTIILVIDRRGVLRDFHARRIEMREERPLAGTMVTLGLAAAAPA